MKIEGKRILITGAASGIGRALALEFSGQGTRLLLLDRNQNGLEETAKGLPQKAEAHPLVFDVQDREGLHQLPATIEKTLGGLDILVNNAGVACHGRFTDIRESDFDWVMDINYHAVVRLTRTLLPLLIASPEARIVNLSSIFGIIAPADETTYVASKFAVRGFSLALRQELLQDHPHVGVTVVHPGGVATNIAKNARAGESATPADRQAMLAMASKTLTMPPQKAARIIRRGIERKRTRILVGNDAKLLAFLERAFPVGYGRLLQWGMAQLSKAQ